MSLRAAQDVNVVPADTTTGLGVWRLRDFPRVACPLLLGWALLVGLLLLASPAWAQGPVIGPGTPCTISWVPPTLNADGTPLTVPLTFNIYLDPPAGGPLVGLTVPSYSVPASPWSVCGALPPVTSGAHTVTVTAKDAGGESPAPAAIPFSLLKSAPSAPSGLSAK